ncbi:MAG TPA: nucleotide exchange factor GrpE [Aeromicrobium sp.]|nr:nucleotide exchange factor GrpE [Aeromicrobium sp.]
MTDPVTEPDEVIESVGEDLPTSEEPAPTEAAGPSLEDQLAERTGDLQRVQAEFINYKRRVEDDRVKAIEAGKQKVLVELLTVLDDLSRADEHGELTGGFKAVADQLTAVTTKFGLESFGVEGEPFDPNLHEAVFHAGEDPDVLVTSIKQVMRTGYLVNKTVLRPAVVGVVDPGVAAETTSESVASDGE